MEAVTLELCLKGVTAMVGVATEVGGDETGTAIQLQELDTVRKTERSSTVVVP